jgi:ATP-dependent DNA helicase RecG
MLQLQSAVQYVKGVGPKIAEILAEKGILTVEDLLYYLPYRYEDRINPRGLAELKPGEMASVIAEVRGSGLFATRRMPIFQLTAGQGTQSIKCLWFNGRYLQGRFQPGKMVALYGKVEKDSRSGKLQMMQPQFEILDDEADPESAAAEALEIGRIVPIYSTAANGKLTSRWFRRLIHGVLENLEREIPDGIPPSVATDMKLMPRYEAFQRVHWPDPGERFSDLEAQRTPAHIRLIFEELFFLELGLESKRRKLRALVGTPFKLTDEVREAIKRILPFHPTAAQKKVLKEIAGDMQQATPMRRLLQGDVGSGKTIVAFEAAIIAIENGYQVALMAPTEILAAQHILSARKILEKAGYSIVLLTGSLDEQQKRNTRRHIARGDAELVIGTHALIQESVEFAKLGLVIVDEQHRFGVMQRFKLMKKPGDADPDVLVMTATPIPRTLALTVYGDLDVSVIDELPPGRTPIVTRRVPDERAPEVWEFVRKQVKAGHQVYVVYPVIEEVEAAEDGEAESSGDDDSPVGSSNVRSDGASAGVRGNGAAVAAKASKKAPAKKKQPSMFAGLKAAVQMFEELRSRVFPEFHVGLMHGRLDADEKERTMRAFAAGELEILVSTTVIEVGVDVPNANTMVIEHAERFGLSQLHQLRGRIGRGAAKSFCILMTGGKVSLEAEQRLDAMVKTTDGFKIAELDLELRGPGEFFGTRQAGMPDFRVANIMRDRDLLVAARTQAAHTLDGDKAELARAMQHLKSHWQRRYGLVEVG